MSNSDSNKKAEELVLAVRSFVGRDRVVLQKRLGQAAVAQAQLGVRVGKDPYGKSWVPLTSRSGQPLRRTGNNIQRSWTAGGETPDTFKFGSRFKYLATHQYGAVIRAKNGRSLRFWVEGATAAQHIRADSRFTRKGREIKGKILIRKGQATQYNQVFVQKVTIPRRQLVPEMDTGGLGKRWLSAFNRVIQRYLATKLPWLKSWVSNG